MFYAEPGRSYLCGQKGHTWTKWTQKKLWHFFFWRRNTEMATKPEVGIDQHMRKNRLANKFSEIFFVPTQLRQKNKTKKMNITRTK